jgi:hypothetical protein
MDAMTSADLLSELLRLRKLLEKAAAHAIRIQGDSAKAIGASKQQVAASKELLANRKRVVWLTSRRKPERLVIVDKLAAAIIRTDNLMRRLQKSRRQGG